ncbi:MAG: sulfatase-like hydrolase/transferase [Bacteroidales bacterium]|nr:sulfatase-like hydrolase/transferase [Bacteroidales bacterium]
MRNSKITINLSLAIILLLGISACTNQKPEESSGDTFKGKIAKSYEESVEDWPEYVKAPEGAPNILLIMLDDVGYGQIGCYGGLTETPNIDKLADNGLRYTNFHTLALCSPSRASVMAGRNHHAIGLGSHSLSAMGFPGYNAFPGENVKSIAKHLQQQGYVNYAIGKWDHTPLYEVSQSGPFDRWPSGEGFDHFYGFMAADADNFRSLVWSDHSPIEDWQGKPGYHYSEAMADKAINYFTSHASVSPDKPWMMYWAPVAMHSPHQAPKEYIEKYKGMFDDGWDKAREIIFAKQKEMGIMPEDAILSKRTDEIPAWKSLKPEEQKLYARQMEAFAGMLDHVDEQIGRMVETLERTGQLENTVIVVTSDNGASGEGGLTGSFNETYVLNGLQTPFDANMKHYDDWGGQETYPHYHAGWALAGNTPFKYFKQIVHRGGVADPFIVHWPKSINAKGELRTQFHHIIDVAATILDVTGVEFLENLDGHKQKPLDGVSLAYSFNDAEAPDRHTQQYFEMLGNRAMYKDGWKAVTIHANRMPWNLNVTAPFEEDIWELYNINEDPTETNNLAEQYPEKLEELIKLWDEEAWKYDVYPLYDNMIQRLVKQQSRLFGDQKEFVYYAPGATRIAEKASAPVKGRSHSIEVDLELSGNEEGVLLACGGFTGGYTLFIKNNKVYYDYNYYNGLYYTIESPPVGTGKVNIKYNFTEDPKGDTPKLPSGVGELFINGKKVGEVTMPEMHISTFSLSETFDVGVDYGTPVSNKYTVKNHYPFTGELDKVIVRLTD